MKDEKLNKFSVLARAINTICRCRSAAQVEAALIYIDNTLKLCKDKGIITRDREYNMWEQHLYAELDAVAQKVVEIENEQSQSV